MIRKLIPLILVAALAGCASSTSHPAAVASSAGPSPSPSPSPTVSVDQLKSWVEAAALTTQVVGAPKPATDQPAVTTTLDVCGKQLNTDGKIVYAHYWRWVGTHIAYVEHTVAAYQDVSGADVIAEIKDLMQACTTYQETDPYGTAQLTSQGEYTFTPPSGVDAGYAYCVLSDTIAPAKDKGEKAYICTATLVRGAIADSVTVFNEKVLSLSNAQHNLDAAVAMAGAALAHAVPADYH